jgi:hypothetical protein
MNDQLKKEWEQSNHGPIKAQSSICMAGLRRKMKSQPVSLLRFEPSTI